MANRYNERYKDMSNEERLREVQDRCVVHAAAAVRVESSFET